MNYTNNGRDPEAREESPSDFPNMKMPLRTLFLAAAGLLPCLASAQTNGSTAPAGASTGDSTGTPGTALPTENSVGTATGNSVGSGAPVPSSPTPSPSPAAVR